uniref:Uncharacterized protein n=1 Tax=Anguilla anguilla TaxID=7936 RepID=A0A0E9SNY1_ANGAN
MGSSATAEKGRTHFPDTGSGGLFAGVRN